MKVEFESFAEKQRYLDGLFLPLREANAVERYWF